MGKIKNAHRDDGLLKWGLSCYKEVFLLELVFLTDKFYSDYADCTEIERKLSRPHLCAAFLINGLLCCVPFRSNINHEYAIWTDKENKCGLDFSKTVVITDREKYIDSSRQARLRPNEYKVFKTVSEHDVKTTMDKYLKQYRRAKAAPQARHNKTLLKYSCIQYFEEYFDV